MVFSFRFFVEFLKENQSGFEVDMTLNMGQLLSLPFVIAGFVFIAKSFKPKTKKKS
jgi:prolipoprotein diacylglyceryltransferase